jgi:hypothetical protein
MAEADLVDIMKFSKLFLRFEGLLRARFGNEFAGDRDMTSTRGNWLRSIFVGLTVLVMGASTVWAQGFGPDPFKPYNSIYAPYTSAIGPATPGAGQSVGVMGRGPNQFQDYLNEIQGFSRAANEKYGIGLPYYRTAIDPRFDRDGRREYQPNRRTEPTFEETMDRVSQKYLAYFSEKDPQKRTTLIRDYNLAQRNLSRTPSSRRSGLRDDLRGAGLSGLGLRNRSGAPLDDDPAIGRETLRSRNRGSDEGGISRTGRGTGGRTIPPAPEIDPLPSNRAGGHGRTPSETLDRARRFDDRMPSSRGSRDARPAGSRAIPAAPPLDE